MLKTKNKLVKRDGKEFYRVRIGRLWRDLPLFEVAPGIKIALFNILGDTRVVVESAKILAKKMTVKFDYIITPEVKSIPLAFEISKITNLPYIVARKICKPYMVDSVKAVVLSITTGKPQTLWLSGEDKIRLKGKKVLLVDDVVSTGSTFLGLKKLMKKIGAVVVGELAIFSEGNQAKWKNVCKVGHLPIFRNNQISEMEND